MNSSQPLSTTGPWLDPDLLQLLRCVQCGHQQLLLRAEKLRCTICGKAYDVRPPGIPRLITNETMLRNAVHEQEWDSMPHADYDQICRELGPVWEAIDSLVLNYCEGSALEICCGNGRFLDVLMKSPRVKRTIGADISMGMLRGAWDKGHRSLIQSSADELPIRSAVIDTVASSGSGLSFLDREKTYAEAARVLRSNGFFVFDLLNFWPSVIDFAWWRYISKGRVPKSEVMREYKLAGNMRHAKQEVTLLRRAGFQVVEMKSVRYVPFFRRRISKLGYWSGFWGSKIGYDTVFVCQKV
jgi:ubiquinone/menaquinone biosynthesis C-methylase UbiE/uncharacterized protein YbaR (Trm112 family)